MQSCNKFPAGAYLTSKSRWSHEESISKFKQLNALKNLAISAQIQAPKCKMVGSY